MNKRLTIYPLVLFFSLILLALPGYLSSPRRNMRAAVKSAALSTSGSHQTFASYFKIYPQKGFILVLYTGNQAEFAPTEYITISRLNATLTIDLINGAGISNVSQLKGKQAVDYLEKHHIELKPIDALVSKSK